MRFLAALALAVATTPVLVVGQSAGPVSAATVPLPPVQARSAASVVDGFGVGVHLAYEDTPYRNTTAVANALAALGVRHVRDDLFVGDTTQYAAIRTVAAKGIDFDLIMGSPSSPRPAKDYVAAVAGQLPGVVSSLEGPNEWDHFSGGGPAWPSQLRARQSALYAAAKADPRTRSLPVLAPSLAFAKNYPLVGDLSAISDVANGHLYPGGRPPSADLSGLFTKLRTVTGASKPIVITEAGYHNALATTDGHHPVPESVHATYLPRLLMEHLRGGAARVYSYELVDEFADPGRTNPEANFGLLRRDLTPKPAYTAMQRLLAVFQDSSTSFAPGSLAYAVEGGRTDLRQLLVQKSTGEFDLVLWRDVSVWDPIARRALNPAPYRVQVRLGQARAGSVVAPTSGATTSFTATDSVPVDLGADVSVVRLTAPAAGGSATVAPTTTAAPARSAKVSARAGRASVRVSWHAPTTGGAPIQEYRVSAGSRTRVVPATTRSTVVRGLPRRAWVRITVQARNDVGWGSAARSGRVRTR
ncbi:Fibronectin type III domain-containing protein [Nocardioides scoriae]|uniref:Fibronectin type III domain-containing protein n=1 Tax=Nocardioides scoriae TaxID=642780 RepID=A0A1H1X0L3_9ACTN|nr:fibronectin type III domain-containing protein [Nocardioides scoriae]SDT02895.1 Fibronectin type III domain-containing protein [Nocardioides scoriae]